MEKRAIIAVVLSVMILLGFQFYFSATAPQKPAVPPKTAETKTADSQRIEEAIPPAASKMEAGSAARPDGVEKTIKVETPLYSATLSSKGATIKTWHIKAHKTTDGQDIGILKTDGGPLRALGLGIGDDYKLSDADFAVAAEDIALSETNKTQSITFTYSGPDARITRKYTFNHDTYSFTLEDSVGGPQSYSITLGSAFGIANMEDGQFVHTGPVVLHDVKRLEYAAKKLKKESITLKDNIKWIAIEDKYFFSALAPDKPIAEARAFASQEAGAISAVMAAGANKMLVYAGPKEMDGLKAAGRGLEHIVDFGFFSIIARPIFWLLKFFHKYVGNYGWAIIILTIVIRIPFIPIVNMGQRSMKRMQKLQPRMAELKEKYKKDPKRLQTEMMGLYKKYKVNPMSGCLPMLLQIPVFFALYKVLLIAIELRGAPWLLWITDLSMKDPYYVLPILMGISMLVQQKLTPSAGDPMQQKIMMILPVVFTFMFLNFASGLVLYWLVNNVLSIAQQIYINAQPDPAEA